MKRLLLLLLGGLLILAGCGGGGGGGGGGNPPGVTLFGRVLSVENGGATVPQSTVRVPGASTSVQTDPADGSFQLDVSGGTTSITVTYAASGGSTPIVRTFNFPAVTANTDLGDLYIGPATVTVTGRIVDSQTGAAVPGALVKLAGIQTTSNASGQFSLPGVAYSNSSLAVFLGLQGQITKAGYFSQFFSPPGAASSGVVNCGTIQVTPEGSSNPPPLPFNIQGTANPVATGAGATVELLSSGTVIRTITADGQGKYTFWAPVGSYTIRARKGAQTATGNVQVTAVNTIVTANVTFP